MSGSPPSTVTYLEGLSPGVTYEVQLQAESAIGLGTFSEVQTATAYDGEGCCHQTKLYGTMQDIKLLYVYGDRMHLLYTVMH